jgi:hypothetical protein
LHRVFCFVLSCFECLVWPSHSFLHNNKPIIAKVIGLQVSAAQMSEACVSLNFLSMYRMFQTNSCISSWHVTYILCCEAYSVFVRRDIFEKIGKLQFELHVSVKLSNTTAIRLVISKTTTIRLVVSNTTAIRLVVSNTTAIRLVVSDMKPVDRRPPLYDYFFRLHTTL